MVKAAATVAAVAEEKTNKCSFFMMSLNTYNAKALTALLCQIFLPKNNWSTILPPPNFLAANHNHDGSAFLALSSHLGEQSKYPSV